MINVESGSDDRTWPRDRVPQKSSFRLIDEHDGIVRRAQTFGIALSNPAAGTHQIFGRNPEVLVADTNVEPGGMLTGLNLGIGNLSRAAGFEVADERVAHC